MVEVAVLWALFTGYQAVRTAIRDRTGTAFDNARAVLRVENLVSLDIERSAQRLVLDHEWLVVAANWFYVTAHFPVSVAVLVVAWVARSSFYPRLRLVVVLTTALGLVGHVLYPLAPPRMLSSLGFVDTMARWGPSPYTDSGVISVANQYAAMPSLHFAWSLIVAWALVRMFPSRGINVVWLHPAVTLLVIVLTANHYLLDAIVGAAVFAVAVGFDRWLQDRRAAVAVPQVSTNPS